jgi:integrase
MAKSLASRKEPSMPKLAKEMSPIEVRNLKHSGKRNDVPEKYAVGGVSGLLLQITPNNAKSWVMRTTIGGERKLLGLGSFPEVSLKDAREHAAAVKASARSGINPIADRAAKRAALAAEMMRGRTFRQAVEEFMVIDSQGKSEKNQKQWRSTLETYAMPELGALAVDDITTSDILRVLRPLWSAKVETATRLRQRMQAIFQWSMEKGYRSSTSNPAAWGKLKADLPDPSKIKKTTHYPAIQTKDLPQWYETLRKSESIGAMALEFLCLTASRSGEVRGATWDEIDFDNAVWIVPASRMKMGREHRIPLCNRALEILHHVPRFAGSSYVFPATKGGTLSDMTLSKFMRDMHAREVREGRKGWMDRQTGKVAVPHGLRSSFRDWAAEKTSHPHDVIEMCLAHHVAGAVERAYLRGDVIEKRRVIMAEWEKFVTTPQKPDKSEKVVNIRGR